ncbi:MAG: peptidoglycan DD-metalloendopeptidase family protein [Pseudomonadales bacterium]|nr:peptidoglycan DD-metalloendopeptidase family protein [Pseudomonadales bacterium]
MNIVYIDRKTGISRTIPVRVPLIASVLLVFSIVVGVVISASFFFLNGSGLLAQGSESSFSGDIHADVTANAEKIELAQKDAKQQMTALTVRMAELQARLTRIDALGERLVDVAKLHNGEFDFSAAPPVGGPQEEGAEDVYERPSFIKALDQLAADVEQREQQLEILESLLANRKIQKEVYLAGRPIKWGWMSSRFGRRTDPFTGKLAWHQGVDFAGKDGSDIISVGSGVVTWAGERFGYGLLVEVNHGGGYSTRYAHAKEVSVKVGDIVHKGQTVALMGSTGRSTGPHVHFEVLKNGRPVDPTRYVNRRVKK